MEGIEIITQAGGIGVALVSLYVLLKINGNHLEHSRQTNEAFISAINRLSDVIEKLREKL